MPFNGSGVYSAPSSPGSFNPAVSGQQGQPADWNTLLADIESALSTVICRDGQSSVTANIPMGGFKLTGVANGSATDDGAAFGQIATALTAAIPTGVVWDYIGATAPSGWILGWGTIGNAASGATNRANADTEPLFTLLWNNWANGQAAVSGGRRRGRRNRLCRKQDYRGPGLARPAPRWRQQHGRQRRGPAHLHHHESGWQHAGRNRRRSNGNGQR